MMYYIVLCYFPQDTGGVYGVLHRSMLHLPGYWWYIRCTIYRTMLHPRGYWWYIRCTISFYVTSPRILVVYKVYYIVLCYIPKGTGDIYFVQHRCMLLSLGYWWCIWCITSFYVTSPRVLVVYKVYYISYYVTSPRILAVYKVYFIVLYYIPEDTCGI